MFHLTDIMQIKEGERVEVIVRRHLLTVLPLLIPAGALIALPFFFLFSLGRLGIVGWILLSVCVLVGGVMALRALWLWDADVCVITNKRMVHADQQGIWTRTVIEIPLSALQEVSLVSARLGWGSLRIRSSVVPSDFVLSRIAHPCQVKNRLQTLACLIHPEQTQESVVSLDEFRMCLVDRIKTADSSSLDEVARIFAKGEKSV